MSHAVSWCNVQSFTRDETCTTANHTRTSCVSRERDSYVANLDSTACNLKSLDAEIHADGRYSGRSEDTIRVPPHYTGLPDPSITYQDNLEQVVVFRLHGPRDWALYLELGSTPPKIRNQEDSFHVVLVY